MPLTVSARSRENHVAGVFREGRKVASNQFWHLVNIKHCALENTECRTGLPHTKVLYFVENLGDFQG